MKYKKNENWKALMLIYVSMKTSPTYVQMYNVIKWPTFVLISLQLPTFACLTPRFMHDQEHWHIPKNMTSVSLAKPAK